MPRLSDVEMMAAPESLMLGKNAALHEEEAMKACPISYVTKDAPPFLLLHGTNDHTVPYTQGEAMYEALTKAGADADLIGHRGRGSRRFALFPERSLENHRRFF